MRYDLESSLAVNLTKKQPGRSAGTDQLRYETKKGFGHFAWGHCVDEVGRAGEPELGDPLRDAEPPYELAVRGGRNEEQETPARGLLQRERARGEADRSTYQQEHLDRSDDEQGKLR